MIWLLNNAALAAFCDLHQNLLQNLKFSGGLDAYIVSYTKILESSRLVRRNVLVIKLSSHAQA